MPGLRKAQETHDFGIAQFTSSSCVPALNTDVAGVPNCRAINDKVLALARELKPDVVLLHSTWGGSLDGVAETVKTLKQQTSARIIVLGAVPMVEARTTERGSALFHAAPWSDSGADPIAPRPISSDARLREKLVPLGAEFISVRDTMCNSDGCLARIGDTAKDLSANDQVHLTEKASIFLIQSIIDQVLHTQTSAPSQLSH